MDSETIDYGHERVDLEKQLEHTLDRNQNLAGFPPDCGFLHNGIFQHDIFCPGTDDYEGRVCASEESYHIKRRLDRSKAWEALIRYCWDIPFSTRFHDSLKSEGFIHEYRFDNSCRAAT